MARPKSNLTWRSIEVNREMPSCLRLSRLTRALTNVAVQAAPAGAAGAGAQGILNMQQQILQQQQWMQMMQNFMQQFNHQFPTTMS